MKRAFIIFGTLLLAFQLSFVESVCAKLYTWVDKNGVTRRTYYPPPQDQVMKKRQSVQPAVRQRKAVNQVELYVTSWCPYCKKAQNYFRSKGIKYKSYDIEKDRNAAMRKKKLDNNGGVPFAIVNGVQISGYAPDLYGRALK